MKTETMIATLSLLFFVTTAPALAEDQTVTGTVDLKGFSNSGISVGIRTSDFGAAYHSCSTGNDEGCTVTDEQSSIPKNIGNVLCLPSNMNASIDSSCKQLLDAGNDESCQKNSAVAYCYANAIAPTCNYRTYDDASTSASWDWAVSPNSNGTVTVDCSVSGYNGYTQ